VATGRAAGTMTIRIIKGMMEVSKVTAAAAVMVMVATTAVGVAAVTDMKVTAATAMMDMKAVRAASAAPAVVVPAVTMATAGVPVDGVMINDGTINGEAKIPGKVAVRTKNATIRMIANGIATMEAVGLRRMEIISIGKVAKKMKNVRIRATTITGIGTKTAAGSTSIRALAPAVLTVVVDGVVIKSGKPSGEAKVHGKVAQ